MKTYRALVWSALVASALAQVRADSFVTITPTGATAAVVTHRWVIGGNMGGLAFIDGNSGFPGATATNFFTVTGAPVPPLGSPTGFTSYLPTGAATPQGSVGNALTPNSYSGLTYVAENLSLIGPLSFYAIHHRTTGDYLTLIQPGVPTVSDQKPMSMPGGPLTLGGTGYFALSYAADNAGGWGAQLFYYLRTNALGETIFGSMVPALLSGPTDRWNLGAGRGYTDLAYTSTNVGFGFGPNQFYYLRLDPLTQTTFFGRLDPLTGLATDIQNLGGVYRTLTFTPTNVGYGANNFYSIGRPSQTITFAPISGHTTCDVPFAFVLPLASSGLPVTLAVSGPAVLSGGNVLTLTGTVGTVVLTASQAGDTNFGPAPSVVQSFAVVACAPSLTAQAITFAPVADRGLCDGAFAVAPTSSSGLPVTLVVTSGPATVVGYVVTPTGTGNITLQTTQVGDGIYASAPPVSRTFAVAACVPAKSAQTITFAPVGDRGLCDGSFTVSPTASSGLPVTLSVTSGPATVSGNTVTVTGVGSVTLLATQAGDGAYLSAAPVSQTFLVAACVPGKSGQTITFPPVGDRGLADASFAVSPTASSGLPVTLSVTSGPATVSGNTVTVTGVGSVTLLATQAGDGAYLGAAPVSQTFLVAKSKATITLDHLTKPYYGPSYTPPSPKYTTTPAGLLVTFTYDGSPTSPTALGTYTVVATIDSAIYEGSITATFTLIPDPRVNQTVSFGPTPLTNRVFGDAPFTLDPSASSGMPVTLVVISGPATLSGNTVTLTGAGTVVMEVSQAGNIATHVFASLTQSFVVAKAVAPIALSNLARTFDGAPKSATAVTTPAGLTVNLTYNGSASAPSAAGSYAVQATVVDANYQGTANATLNIASTVVVENPVTTVGGVIPVSPIRLTQTITFAPITSATVNVPVALSASSSAGLTPISFTVVSGSATLNGATLTPLAPGPMVVRAYQAGGVGHQPAFAEAAFTVHLSQSITFNSPVSALTIHTPVQLSAGASSGLPVTFVLVSGDATLVGATLTPTGPGTIVVRATQAGDAAYAPVSTVVDFGRPQKAAQSVSLSLSDVTVLSGPITLAAQSTAGLPITYAVTGPARIAGNILTLTGAAGTVTVRAMQPGNDLYLPAAEVVRTFAVRATGPQVYLGKIGSDTFAAVIAADNSTGVFVTCLTASGEAIVASFALNADGSFRASGTSSFPAAVAAPSRAALTAPRTLSGTVMNGVLTGSILELGLNFSASVAPPTGPTAALAGVYRATVPGSASGETFVVAGPTGEAYAVSVTPLGVNSGSGSISADGVVAITTSSGSIGGRVTPSTGVINGTVAAGATTAAFVGLSDATRRTDRLVNLSSRLRVVSGDATRSVIAGFVLSGEAPQRLLVRAVGPGLGGFGVSDALANPRLQVYRGSTLVAENDDWGSSPDVSATGDGVGAFKLGAGSRDAALVADLAPGAYTAVVTGVSGSGVALIEVYDATSHAPITAQQLVNLSTRGFVEAVEGSLIAGFVVTGNAPKRVLLRGIGPGLAQFGVAGALADPRIGLYSGAVLVAANDNWETGPDVAQMSASFALGGAFALPAGSKDAALVVTLLPGAYTVQVSGPANASGVALVEIYDLK